MPTEPAEPRTSRASLVGPLAGWELVRLARRGQALRARLMVLYLLALTLAGFAAAWFYFSHPSVMPGALLRGGRVTLSLAESALFAERFAFALLAAQLAAVAAITPAYAAAAVAEEKERQTLPLLLTTGLSDREIVWGKAVGRAAFVLAAAAAGLPVMTLVLWFGGVDLLFLVYGYCLVAGTAVLATAIGVNAACHTPDLRSAVLRAYGSAFLLIGGAGVGAALSPFGALLNVQAFAEDAAYRAAWGPGYALAQVFIASLLLAEASRRLRGDAPGRARLTPGSTAFPAPPKPAEPVAWEPRPVVRVENLPPVDEADPVLWKERHVRPRVPVGEPNPNVGLNAVAALVGFLAVLLIAVGAGALLQRLARLQDEKEAVRIKREWPTPPDVGGSTLMAGAVLAAGLYLVPVAVGVAGVIARERQRQTLESLLSVPLDRRAVLRSKVRAWVRRWWGLAPLAVLAVGVAFGADGGLALGAEGGCAFGLAAAAAELAGMAFVLGLGAWLSVRCPSDLRAFRLLLPALVVAVGWPVGVWNGTDWAQPQWTARGLGAAAVVLGAAAVLLWRRAGRDLERGA